MTSDRITAWAPGRVNLIGDHTDYTGGLVLPMAIDLGTTVRGHRDSTRVDLRSLAKRERTSVALDVVQPSTVTPYWARYVAGVVAELRPTAGFRGTIATTLPVGAGLSSSAALEVALALALGADGSDPVGLAARCQRAEQEASGVPCGIMDQLASTAGVEGHALLIDCHALTVEPIPVPEGLAVVVIHSGQPRSLAGSAYADRRAECERAEEVVGPLRLAEPGAEAALTDPVLRARARHVITENERVRRFAVALRRGATDELGALLAESHASLRDDFEVSIPAVDQLVARLAATPGVHGARMTGGGFGGCVVALTEPGALAEGWTVRPSRGAHLVG